MGWSKLCRSERCRRTRPPRPVHGEQRLLQRSVTTAVMQITDYATVISVLDFSVPSVTRTAFRTGSTACRVGAPDQRTHGGPRATWTGLVASVSGVTNGRSRAACGSVRRPWNAVVAHCRTDPGRCGGRARGGGTDRDGTVITLKRQSRHPRVSHRRHVREPAGRPPFVLRFGNEAPAGDDVGPGRRHSPLSPVPVAHDALLTCRRVRSGPVVEAGHQFQLRTAVPSARRALRCVRTHQFQLRTAVPSCCGAIRGAAVHRFRLRTAPSVRSTGRVGRGHQFQLRIAASSSGSGSSGKRPGLASGRFGTTSRGRRHASTAPGCAGRVRRLPRYG